MSEQLLPAPGRCVAGRNFGHRLGPRDREVRIVVGNCNILLRPMRTVDSVADVGRRGEHLKTVQETRRNVEVSKIMVVEQNGLLHAECRRSRSDVNNNVMNRTMSAADKLRLAHPATAMHAPDDAAHGPRLRILDKSRGCARLADVMVEHLGVECAGEQSALVSYRLRRQHRNASKTSLLDTHKTMLS